MAADAKASSRKNEIIIALIGLLGIVVTAALSNWEKIFPHEVNVSTQSENNYKPSGDIDIELRYYFELIGIRNSIKALRERSIENVRKKDKLSDEEINSQYLLFSESEVIESLVEAYKKYVPLEVVQEYNRFYSKDKILELAKIEPIIVLEFLDNVEEKLLQRFKARKARDKLMQEKSVKQK